jgi:hypothetical protein|tara:strand:+ start:404 stop:664 length:261 start_codon:yes stop_codon:yes gene_type:complete
MPYAKFVRTYGYKPKVRGLSEGEVDIGLLACVNKIDASNVLMSAQGITAALDSDAYMSVLQASGASDKQLQNTELQILKSKNASRR